LLLHAGRLAAAATLLARLFALLLTLLVSLSAITLSLVVMPSAVILGERGRSRRGRQEN